MTLLKSPRSTVLNIFGAGRSATKSCLIQSLYAAHHAKKTCWVNYEPYYWQDCSASRPNYYAIKVHERSSLIFRGNETNQLHDKFLKSLVENDSDIIINKFIRGLGRVSRINEVTSPGLSVFVVRDLYQQLSSIFAARWDLLGQGLEHTSDTRRFIAEISSGKADDVPNLKYLCSKLKNRLDVNALYWYVMNWLAADQLDPASTICVFKNFKNIDEVGQSVFEYLDCAGIDCDIFDFGSKIQGHEIHSERLFPLRSKTSSVAIFNTIISRVANNSCFAIPGGSVGSMVNVNAVKEYQGRSEEAYSEYGGVGKLIVESNEFYNMMESEIERKLAAKFSGVRPL